MKLKAITTAGLMALTAFTLVLFSPSAGATTTTYNTTADAFTASDLPNTVENTTYVSMDASPLRYSYFKFAVTVPAGEAVTSAVFKCWPGSSNTSGMGLWTTSSGWSETTLTWNNAPVPNFGLPASGNTGAVTSGSYSAVADVTSAITGTGTYTLVGKTTSSTQWSCTSKENSGNHPAQLVVTTSPVDNPPVAALTVTPSSGTVPLAVTADASASTDTDSTPISTYTFAWGDGTSNTGPQSGATAPHTYTAACTCTVTVIQLCLLVEHSIILGIQKRGAISIHQILITIQLLDSMILVQLQPHISHPWFMVTLDLLFQVGGDRVA